MIFFITATPLYGGSSLFFSSFSLKKLCVYSEPQSMPQNFPNYRERSSAIADERSHMDTNRNIKGWCTANAVSSIGPSSERDKKIKKIRYCAILEKQFAEEANFGTGRIYIVYYIIMYVYV